VHWQKVSFSVPAKLEQIKTCVESEAFRATPPHSGLVESSSPRVPNAVEITEIMDPPGSSRLSQISVFVSANISCPTVLQSARFYSVRVRQWSTLTDSGEFKLFTFMDEPASFTSTPVEIIQRIVVALFEDDEKERAEAKKIGLRVDGPGSVVSLWCVTKRLRGICMQVMLRVSEPQSCASSRDVD
jgi:hypothetical protein